MEIPSGALPAAVAIIIFTSLSLIFVSLRLYTRALVVKNVGADDYLIVGAWGGSIAFLVAVFLQIKGGLGRPVSFPEIPNFLMWLWVTILTYNVALILCKISIAIQYYRVFRTPKVQKLLIAMLVFLVAYGLWAVLGTVFTCVPVNKYWDVMMREGTCLDRNAITYANAGINIATDFVLLAIPVSLLRKLQIPRRQKMVLIGVFTCGAFACAMSIVRLKSLYEIGSTPPPLQSVKGVNIAIWSCIEINIAIICASVPAIKALVVKVFPKLLLSSLYARTKNRYHGGTSGGVSGGALAGQRYLHRSGATVTATGGTGRSAANSSSATTTTGTDPGIMKKSEITVVQSFELNAVTRAGGGGRGDDNGSSDGSENGLVVNSWQANCYAGAMNRGDGDLALWPRGGKQRSDYEKRNVI